MQRSVWNVILRGAVAGLVGSLGWVVAASTSVPAASTISVTRLAGADRDLTSVVVSQTQFQAGQAKVAVLASDAAFPDALAGTPLAVANNSPLLLTKPSGLVPAVANEISRVLPVGGTVYVLGGTLAVAPSVDAQLRSMGYMPQRLAGADRFATAVSIAQALGSPSTVLEATGLDFPDGLSAGVAAASLHAAVLLTDGAAQAPVTAAYRQAHPGQSYAVGGPAASADPQAVAIVGADRYETSTKVAQKFFAAPTTVAFASGEAFPDALSGGAHAAAHRSPLVLAPRCGPLPTSVSSYLTAATSITAAYLYGGTFAVCDQVAGELAAPGSPIPAQSGFAASLSANHRYILDPHGVPWLMVGESAQALIANVSTTDAATYFADRQAKGINAVWVNLIADGHPSSTRADGSTYDGILPFTTPGDLSTPNPTYWQRVDQMLTLAMNHGVTVFADPAETAGMLSTLKSNGATKSHAYGAFIGSRYKGYPNIVWLLGNDFQTWSSDPTGDADLAALSDGIRSAGDTHLQTLELNYYASTSLDDASTWASRIDLNLAYSYRPTYDMTRHGYNQAPTLPVFFGEGNYEFGPGWMGETVTPNTLRRQGWWAMTSGAFGQMWGTRPTTNFSSGWQAQLGTTGVVEYGYWRSFWQAVNWTSVVPDQANSFLTSGEGAYSASGLLANSNYSTATLSPDGSLGVVYLPAATTVTLDLSKMRGTVTAQWFDPTTGVYSSAGTWPNSGTHSFAASGAHADGASDWVLLLKA